MKFCLWIALRVANTAFVPTAHGWLVTSARQACLPPWVLVVEVQNGRVALETIQERIAVISGVIFWKKEICQMNENIFFFSHLMSFRGKNTFIIYICNHKALPRASLGQEIVDGQVFTYWTCILSYSVIVRGVMGTVLIPLLGKLCHRFGHILPPWGPRGMRLQGTVCDLYALPLPSFSHGSLPWQQNSLLQGRLWDEAVSLWRGWVLVSPLFRGTWPGWGGAQ